MAPAADRPSFRADAVLLDLDGTLVHTAPDLADSVDRMLADLGRPRVGSAVVEGWIGDGVSRLVKRALTGRLDGEPETALYERGYARFVELYGQRVSARSRPFPGAREGLVALHAAGVPLACVTSKLAIFTDALLRDLDMARFFALVVAGDSLERKKPDPLPLLHVCDRLGVEPAHTVLVGDSMNDARAARAAGAAFVAVTYGYRGGREPEALGADLLIDSLDQLLAHLDPRPRATSGRSGDA